MPNPKKKSNSFTKNIQKISSFNEDLVDLEKQALICINKGDIETAKTIYRNLIKKGSLNHIVYGNLAVICGNDQKDESIQLLMKAIKIKPNYFLGYYNLGNIYLEEKKIKEACEAFQKAIDINPNHIETYINLGNTYLMNDDSKKAINTYQEAININPSYVDAYINIGNAHKKEGDLREAINYYKKATHIDPNRLEVYVNISLTELLRSNYDEGWKHYELRSQTKVPTLPHVIPQTHICKNLDSSKSKKLLIVSEQGLGDTIQYMRYIQTVREKGFDVYFCPQSQLHELIIESKIDMKPLTVKEAKSFSGGEWISLLSLPKYLQITPINPITNSPYLKSNRELNKKWKDILSQETKPIIGINWQGNPNVEKHYLKGRSFPLHTFSKLIEQNDITLLSLQKGYGSEQMRQCSFKDSFVKDQDKINAIYNFVETTSIMENCNLIITSDTAIAHLAGAMGKEVWLLLQKVPYWTWGMLEERTFWYPSMKIFRQKKENDWNEVMQRVSQELKNKKF